MAEIGCNWARIGSSKSSQSLSIAHKWAVYSSVPDPVDADSSVLTVTLEGLQSKGIDQEGQRCLMERVMRNKAFLHMLCILHGFLDVLVKGVKLVNFLLYLVSNHGWPGLSTQPTLKEVDRWEIEKVKALGANGDMSGSRVWTVWMEVGGGISVLGNFLGGFWVDELALEAMEFDD
ncbi:hypothetical protein Tco_0940749 [Tanacetum coccineum]|uniref:Uncharacterized protein n=1 Tax=Tanacetum coccineum TaxID=301880 RepID=A0ABQ5DVL4_9ASTR